MTTGRGDREWHAAKSSDLFGLLLESDIHALGVRGLPMVLNGSLDGMGLFDVFMKVVGRDGAFAEYYVAGRD